jgi:hypothetical protein
VAEAPGAHARVGRTQTPNHAGPPPGRSLTRSWHAHFMDEMRMRRGQMTKNDAAVLLILFDRKAFFSPQPDAAVHREDVGISHLLQVLSR